MNLVKWWQSTSTEERLIIYGLILAILVAIAIYVIKYVRGNAMKSSPEITDYLGTFRQLHDEGAIGSEEYEKVRSTISAQAVEELAADAEEETNDNPESSE